MPIWASIRGRQSRARRDQSRSLGVRLSGSEASASRISSRLRPSCWDTRMNEIRRMVAGWYRRWLPSERSEVIRPSVS
jgi:hypothetical protein